MYNLLKAHILVNHLHYKTGTYNLFSTRLCWETILAYNKEVVLKKIFFEKIKKFNPGLPQKVDGEVWDKQNEGSRTKPQWILVKICH